MNLFPEIFENPPKLSFQNWLKILAMASRHYGGKVSPRKYAEVQEFVDWCHAQLNVTTPDLRADDEAKNKP